MVRFCNQCKRAIDDLDKFCRSCGHSAGDSIDYYTYYRSPMGDNSGQDALLWFKKGDDIAIRQEIGEIKKKVDSIYQKLFPSSAKELREKYEDIFRKEDKDKFKGGDKKEEFLTQDDVEKSRLKLENHIKELTSRGVEKEDEEKVSEKSPEIKIEKEDEEKRVEKESEDKNWPWPEEYIGEDVNKKKDNIVIPQEVNDKLNGLLQNDEGHRQAVQYLINKYKGKDKKTDNGVGGTGNINNNRSDNKSSINNDIDPGTGHDTGHSIAIVPQEDVVRVGRARGKAKEKGEPYKMYDVAIHPFIPDILKSIESSKDGMIRVRLSDIAKKMGGNFVDKKHVTIYTGLKYSLFDHNIVVEMGSLKQVDPVTKENIKILKMRMKNPDDKLPPSLLERRGDIE